jgi:uncharacterized membrane protein
VGVRDLPGDPTVRPRIAASVQVGVSAAAGILLAVPIALATAWALFPIVAWDITALVYAVWVWRMSWKLNPEETAQAAVPQDPTRRAADFLALTAAVASLVAVGFILGRAANSQGAEQGWLAGLGVVSVVISWTVVHTVFTLRYARLYYTETDSGIEFGEEEEPAYSDFAYVAFTVGMASQVADTELCGREMRKTALYHSLLAFLFATGIVATAINLVSNLGQSGG